ncbi:hypothetical protein [Paenibacillus sedimenti]|uniref:hypothetical protein n=1 Tax=Paenibacillus sedimenti TaxID=2770274 RepID=UPI00289FD825|nr:hypothetical protein [Paenibacillus sedimenti]
MQYCMEALFTSTSSRPKQFIVLAIAAREAAGSRRSPGSNSAVTAGYERHHPLQLAASCVADIIKDWRRVAEHSTYHM